MEHVNDTPLNDLFITSLFFGFFFTSLNSLESFLSKE